MEDRWINDDRRTRFATHDMVAFICECGSDGCGRTVLLTPEQYDDRCSDAAPIVHDAHDEIV